MPKPAQKTVSFVTGDSSEPRLGFDGFLAKLPAKDRTNVQKRIAAAADAPPDGGLLELWRRLACALFALAPFAPKTSGRQAVQYYVADGKYRMQVFALEDLNDGSLSVYCPDVLEAALNEGVLAAPAASGVVDVYGAGDSPHVLTIKLLDRTAIDPPAYYKDMIGWNRRAVQITLPAAASAAQVEAAEAVCAIAAQRFAKPAGSVS